MSLYKLSRRLHLVPVGRSRPRLSGPADVSLGHLIGVGQPARRRYVTLLQHACEMLKGRDRITRSGIGITQRRPQGR